MKTKILKSFVPIVMSFLIIMTAMSPICPAYAEDLALLPAFPGAEGAGMYATGGRGGTVYHVTNLNDSGTGSFRDAVSGSNRIVVFDVGGTIQLKSDVVVKSNVTILGQTAPGGGGITLSGYKLGQGGSNQIIRFISSRPGERGSGEYDAWGGNNGSNSIVDHCSIGWANDEQWGLYSNNTNQTVQYSIIGPSNCVSTHAKGAHGFGIMFGSYNISWHHNMIAHNISRNFRGKVGSGNSADFVNNVIYDWGYQTGYGTLGHLNYVGNYLKAGNSTRGSYHFFVRSSGTGYENYKFFVAENKIQKKDGSDYSSAINSDNWNAVGFDKSIYGSDTPFEVYDVNGNNVSVALNAESADDAFEHVLAYAGAGIDAESRPLIDREVMDEAKNGTGYLTGGRDFSEADSDQLSAISKYNIKHVDYDEYYPSAVQKTIVDTDGDGMPDDWETARGLDPNKDDATGDYLGEGYMNIEYYANDLTVNAFPEGVVTVSTPVADFGDDYYFAIEDEEAISLPTGTISTPDELVLPTVGSVHGSTITWSSATAAVKIEDNTVTDIIRPESANEAVSIVAQITHGAYTRKKYFSVKLKATSVIWAASAEDKGKAADTKLANGLYTVSELTNGSSANVTINESAFTYYVSGTSNGGWSDGKAIGTAFRFKPTEDGYLTAYITNLGDTKTAYIVKEGASDYKTEALASASGADGTDQMLTAQVEANENYYVFVDGSKGRFVGITFSVKAPTVFWKASNDVVLGEALMNGLTASDSMTYTEKLNKSIDGIDFTGCIAGSANPGGDPKGSEGSALKYTAPKSGLVTVYYKIGTGKVFKFTDSTGTVIAQYENEKVLDDDGNSVGESEYTSTAASVEKGETYYIYVDGSKAEFYGVSYEMTGETEPPPTADPNATSVPTATPAPPTMPPVLDTWDFENITAGTVYSSGDKISNTDGKQLAVSFASSGSQPVIEASDNGNYLKFTDENSGQDGWAYEPDTPLDDDKVIIELDFNMASDVKDAIIARVFDKNNMDNANTYTSDDRVFEIKTSGSGTLVFTDYFSMGSSETKGLDTAISDFAYSPNVWYSLKIEYTKSDGKVKVYTRQVGGEYKQVLNYTLASGTTTKVNGSAPALAPTKIQSVTPGTNSLTISVDNISIGTQTDGFITYEPEYTVTVSDGSEILVNGDATASSLSAKAGDNVMLKVMRVVGNDIRLSTQPETDISYLYDEETDIDTVYKYYSFTMPEQDVVVNVENIGVYPQIYNAFTENGNTIVETIAIGTGVVIGVKYDENGLLTDIKYAELLNSSGYETTTLEGIEADKVMVWNSFADMSPVYNIAPFVIEK